jgi:hypothetical protein
MDRMTDEEQRQRMGQDRADALEWLARDARERATRAATDVPHLNIPIRQVVVSGGISGTAALPDGWAQGSAAAEVGANADAGLRINMPGRGRPLVEPTLSNIGPINLMTSGEFNTPEETKVLGVALDSDADLRVANGRISDYAQPMRAYEFDVGPFGVEFFHPEASARSTVLGELIGVPADIINGRPGSGFGFSPLGPGVGVTASTRHPKVRTSVDPDELRRRVIEEFSRINITPRATHGRSAPVRRAPDNARQGR